MILILVLFAALNNALQIALMADYYRKMDTLSAVTYRGLSLGVTMLPLLLLVPFSEIAWNNQFLLFVAIASVSALSANWIMAHAFHYFSVPIATALGMGFWSIIIAVLAFFSESELLSAPQIVLIVVTLIISVILGITRNTGNKLLKNNRKMGVLLTFLFGVFIGTATLFVGKASRTFSPYLTSYCWEATIGILGLLVAVIRGRAGTKGIARVTFKDFLRIMLFSAPTMLGTAIYAYTVTKGKMGIISSMFISATIVFSTLLAYLLYKEKLNLKQTVLLITMISLIIVLKLIS